MKTLLSFVFGVSMCCLLTSQARAVDGFALTTHRPGGSDHGFGAGPTTFGEIVRHDIKDSRVVGSRVIYPGKARATGDGRPCFMRP